MFTAAGNDPAKIRLRSVTPEIQRRMCAGANVPGAKIDDQSPESCQAIRLRLTMPGIPEPAPGRSIPAFFQRAQIHGKPDMPGCQTDNPGGPSPGLNYRKKNA